MTKTARLLLGGVLVLGACDEGGGPNPIPASAGGAGAGGTAGAASAGESGSAGMAGMAGMAGAASLPESSGPRVQHPNPIVSRGKVTFSQPQGGAAVVDGTYHAGGWFAGSPSEQAPAWVAIQLGAGPSRILLQWDDGGTYNYQDPSSVMVYGLPGAYHVDVSNDSTNGQDGTWTSAVSVAGNSVRTRGHAIDFSGQSWVKLVITAPPPNAANGVTIGEIDVHDLSATGSGMPDDTWLFMGDSITAFAYDRAAVHQPSFAAGINAALPGYFPALINAGIGGEVSAGALARLDATLELNPDYHFVVLGYGTNDAGGGQAPLSTFKSTMQTLIERVRAAGRVPVIPHIPLSGDGNHALIPMYNQAIDELNEQEQLQAGPDLYAYFSDNTGLFTCPPCGGGRATDNLHPNDDGLKGMNAQWTLAMRSLYPAQ
jgi:acyl-CoA thioesterase-1